MEAPLIQGMGSAQGEEKTCCETHVSVLLPCDDTPLTCPESACCHAPDLASPAPDPRAGYWACCLNAFLPGCGTCTVGCVKGSRRAKCVGILTVALAIPAVVVVLDIPGNTGQCFPLYHENKHSCDFEDSDLHDGKACLAVYNEAGNNLCGYWPPAPFGDANNAVYVGALILLGFVYTCTCAWSCRIEGFLSRKPDEPREPALKFMTSVPTVNPCEAVFFGVLNCLVPGAGAVGAAAVGTENRAYGVKAGVYQMLLAAAPWIVMVVVQIALFTSFVGGDVDQGLHFVGLSPILLTLAIACYALNWLWSCLYGYLLIKHNTQLISQFDAPATPVIP